MLFLHQLQWLYHFYPSFFKCDIDTDLWVLNYPCIPEVNSTWSWCMILFMYYWILFANILLRTVFHLFVRPVIFVFCGVLMWLWYWSIATLVKWVWSVPLLCFGRILKDWCSCFIDSVKLPGPGLLFVERFLIIDPISFYVMSILLHITENYRVCIQCTS